MSGESKQPGSGDPNLSQFGGSERDSVETGGYDTVAGDSGLSGAVEELTSPPNNERLSPEATALVSRILGNPTLHDRYLDLHKKGDPAALIAFILDVEAQLNQQ